MTKRKPPARHPQARPAARPLKPDASRRELTWIAISFTDFERAIIEELFRRGGFARLDDVIMAGLWHLAKQLDVPVTTFARRFDRSPLFDPKENR